MQTMSLQVATQKGMVEAVRALVAAGAPLEAEDGQGRTALQVGVTAAPRLLVHAPTTPVLWLSPAHWTILALAPWRFLLPTLPPL